MHRGHVRCTGGAPQNGAQGAPKNPVHRGRFTRDLIAGRPMCTVLTRPLCTVFGAPRVHRILGAPCAPFKDAPCAPFLGAPCAPDFSRIRPLCTDFSLRRPLCTGFFSKRHPVHRIQSSQGSVTQLFHALKNCYLRVLAGSRLCYLAGVVVRVRGVRATLSGWCGR